LSDEDPVGSGFAFIIRAYPSSPNSLSIPFAKQSQQDLAYFCGIPRESIVLLQRSTYATFAVFGQGVSPHESIGIRTIANANIAFFIALPLSYPFQHHPSPRERTTIHWAKAAEINNSC
jgi:hypothetical protein